MSEEKPNFFKSHADALAVVAVNIAIAAILVTMCISNSSRIDTLHVMFYDLLREVKK